MLYDPGLMLCGTCYKLGIAHSLLAINGCSGMKGEGKTDLVHMIDIENLVRRASETVWGC